MFNDFLNSSMLKEGFNGSLLSLLNNSLTQEHCNNSLLNT